MKRRSVVLGIAAVSFAATSNAQIPFLGSGGKGSLIDLNGNNLYFNLSEKVATFSFGKDTANGSFYLVEFSGTANDGEASIFGSKGVNKGASMKVIFGSHKFFADRTYEEALYSSQDFSETLIGLEKNTKEERDYQKTKAFTSVPTGTPNEQKINDRLTELQKMIDDPKTYPPANVLEEWSKVKELNDMMAVTINPDAPVKNQNELERLKLRLKELGSWAKYRSELDVSGSTIDASLIRKGSNFLRDCLALLNEAYRPAPILDENGNEKKQSGPLEDRIKRFEEFEDRCDKLATKLAVQKHKVLITTKGTNQMFITSGLLVGVGSNTYAMYDVNQAKPFFNQNMQLPEARYILNVLTPNGRFGFTAGYAEEVNTDNVVQKDFSITQSTTDPITGITTTSTIKKTAYVGTLTKEFNVPVAFSYAFWPKGHEGQLGMSITLDSSMNKLTKVTPTVCVFISEKNAPTKVKGGIAVKWEDQKPQISLVTSIKF